MLRGSQAIIYQFDDDAPIDTLFESLGGGESTGGYQMRYLADFTLYRQRGEARMVVMSLGEFDPSDISLSHAEVVWRTLLKHLPPEVRAELATPPWYSQPTTTAAAGMRGVLATHQIPDILLDHYDMNVEAALQGLRNTLGTPLAALRSVHLDPAELHDYVNLSEGRHVLVLTREITGVVTETMLTANVGVNLRLPSSHYSRADLEHAVNLFAQESGLEYLGPFYLLNLPAVTSLPLVGLRFTGATVLLGPWDTSQQVALVDFLAQAVRDNDFGEAGLEDWVLRGITANFERSLRAYHQDQLDQARHDAQEWANEAANYLSRYLSSSQRARAANLLLEQGTRELDERGLERVRRMVRNGSLTGIRMRGSNIVAQTKHIYIQDARSGVWHDIGPFEMRIDLGTGNYRFINQLRQYVRHHPHVFGSGEPCLGTLAEAVPQMRNGRDWPAFIELGLLYLESVNYSDGHMNLHRFPVVPVPEAVGLTPHEGDAPVTGLPIPDVPEGDEDFGEPQQHCFIRREGDYYYHLPGTDRYYDYHGQQVDLDTLDPVAADPPHDTGNPAIEVAEVAVTRGAPYNPDDYNAEDEVLVDEHGTRYVWDEDYGMHLNAHGYDPEGFDPDGLDEDGNDRHERRMLDFADRVAAELATYNVEASRDFGELDTDQIEHYHDASGANPTIAARQFVADEERREAEAVEAFTLELREQLLLEEHIWHANRLDGMDLGELRELYDEAHSDPVEGARVFLENEQEPESEEEAEEVA